MLTDSLYVTTVYQSEGSCNPNVLKLQARLTSEGIPWREETSEWRDCERTVPSSEPGGWETDFDAIAQLTLSVAAEHLERGRAILKELGLN